MTENLKKKAIGAIVWNAVQRYGALILSFCANIILARKLTPDDYGLIGIMSVFVAVATSVTDSGFSSALIQNKHSSQEDYCTVFFWNVGVAIILYLILFFSAPFLGKYFNKTLLCPILRLQGTIIIINAFSSVQTTRLTKLLNFKALAIRTLIATFIASSLSVLLALLEYGVWSLVWQAIANSLVGVILLWYVAKWKPQCIFSWHSFRSMLKFGSYIFISGICNTLYLNIQSFIIGKAFSVKDLGYYSQAKRLEQVPVEGTSSVLAQVLFPIYATISDDRQRHLSTVRKNIKVITFVTFPLMVLLIIVAKPLIVLLFTEKWLPSIGMFQILCIVGMFSPVNVANTEIFRSIGAGSIYFNLQTTKRVVGLVFIFISIPFGLYAMLWTIAGMSIVTYMMNLYCTNRYFNYKYSQQLKDICPNLVLTIISGGIIASLLSIIKIPIPFIELLIGVICYLIIYASGAFIFRMSSPKLIFSLLKNK